MIDICIFRSIIAQQMIRPHSPPLNIESSFYVKTKWLSYFDPLKILHHSIHFRGSYNARWSLFLDADRTPE